MLFFQAVTVCVLAGQGANAVLTADLSSVAGMRETAKILAKDLMSFYTGMNPGDVPGNLPDPYYWWEAGAMRVDLPKCPIPHANSLQVWYDGQLLVLHGRHNLQ